MHSTAEINAKLAALQAQIDALSARISPITSAAEAAAAAEAEEIAKAQAAAKAHAEGSARHDAWMIERQAKIDAAEAERARASTAGLPAGQYRDPCGLVREIGSGKIVGRVEKEKAELEAIERRQAAEYREYKKLMDLPLNVPDADDEPAT